MVNMWVLWTKYCYIFILLCCVDGFAYEDGPWYSTDDYSSRNLKTDVQLLDRKSYHHGIHKRQSDLKQNVNDIESTTAAESHTLNDAGFTKKPALSVKSNITTLSNLLENLSKNETGRKNCTLTDPSKQDDDLQCPTLKPSVNHTKTDSQTYYNSAYTIDLEFANKYWVNLENNDHVKVSSGLSNAYRRGEVVSLSFGFPFYGNTIRNVTITTGGFLYMGQYIHSWLAATQYIAPLMANFATGLSNSSSIMYLDDGISFTVQWEKVSLHDKPSDGEFTFQTTLFSNGDIVFVYKNVPVALEKILDDKHPIKVGLSDAYILEKHVFFVKRKTIYEYHRVQLNKDEIKNNTVIYLTALPTCLSSKDCHTCLTTEVRNFKCTWCRATNRCSNGIDWHREDWLANHCDMLQISNETGCSQENQEEFKNHYITDKELDHKKPVPTFNTSTSQNVTQTKSPNATEQSVMLNNTVA